MGYTVLGSTGMRLWNTIKKRTFTMVLWCYVVLPSIPQCTHSLLMQHDGKTDTLDPLDFSMNTDKMRTDVGDGNKDDEGRKAITVQSWTWESERSWGNLERGPLSKSLHVCCEKNYFV